MKGNKNIAKTISDLKRPESVFATTDGSIYIGNGERRNGVAKWSWNSKSGNVIMYIGCRSLFIDRINTIYCSVSDAHVVIKKKNPDNLLEIPKTAAGTWKKGSDSKRLHHPKGIFVSSNFSLYVADYGNDRIQMFISGSLDGITVVSNRVTGTISLNEPIDVTLDANGYLFIVDSGNHRIVGSGPNGYRCIIGCSRKRGSASNQLNYPRALSFDTSGNIYVADGSNGRIQKFSLIQQSGGMFKFIVIDFNAIENILPIDSHPISISRHLI